LLASSRKRALLRFELTVIFHLAGDEAVKKNTKIYYCLVELFGLYSTVIRVSDHPVRSLYEFFTELFAVTSLVTKFNSIYP